MIKLLIFVAGTVLSSLLGKIFTLFWEKSDGRDLINEYKNEVRPFKSCLYIGLVFSVIALFFGSPVVFSDNIGEKLEGILCMIIVGIPLGLVPIMFYSNVRFNYDSCGFSYRNFFRKRYEYNYSQIKEIEDKPSGLKIKMDNGKRIYILNIYNGSEELINKIIMYLED